MGNDSSLDSNDANRGNTVVRAKKINIDNALNVYTNQSESKFKQSGLTVSVSNSLIDSAKDIDSLVDAGGNTDSVRMKGMAAVAGALKTRSLAKEAASAAKGLASGVNAGSLKGLGNTRIQATIGSQKSQSNSSSYTEVNQGSNINTNNLALIATGAGKDSNININGSNINVTNNALFQADNDFNVSGVAQNSNTRSTNSSSSAAIGGYASTGSGVGITASASRGKGYANSDSVTYANSNINVGATTTLDIGNDLNLKGGVINTGSAQGSIGGNVNIESLQDTATYDSNQKNAGFTLDVALEGVGSSLSLNGGKTDINADYKAVGEQSGIFTGDGGFDLTTEGKTTLIGGAIITTDAALQAGRNNYVSKGGIVTQDIENTTSYKGDAISIGLSAGKERKPSMSGLGYGSDSDSDSSTTKAGITGIAGNSGITTDNRAEYAGALENVFDETRVNEELGAQVEITQAFDQERRKIKNEIEEKKQKLLETAAEQDKLGNITARDNLVNQADKLQTQGLIFDAISGALYGPNSNGTIGYAAKAASPFIASQIGDYFKNNRADNRDDNGNRLEPGSAAHILAHGILGAAVSYATGNDVFTGGLSASAGEATAPLISQFLYQTKDTDKLTAEQKDTIRGIVSLTGVVIGSTTGSVTDSVNAGETALVAVEDNYWNKDPNHGSNSTQVVPDWMLPHMPVFGKNAKGQTIICIPTSSHSCGASSNFRVATDQEMVNSVKAGAVMIVGSAVGGKGAEYTLKIGGKIVNKYKTLKQAQKAAEDSVQKARVTNNNQIDDDLGNKPSGKREIAKGLNGKDFEDWLHSSYGGSKSFSKGGREFDGAFGNRWYEAKSGNYWRDVTSKSRGLEKFKSDMGARKRIANENGGTYELHSNTPIPKDIKDWLNKKGISSYEHQ
ncbi:hemagglutinin repeat-containing protein [Psychrobacter jeotgali]|uniref:hemagglutinin repeat-containing protein n=1 Tax=Psychrobacter jeotgali TaxID=179010 RepID=UPI00191B6BA5|nr:hemagglutinin repeat-containing protein [Psychrobacter jeotgali]